VATHDYVIANGTGAAVRSDINGALAAIVSQNSNASAPATTYAYMSWADTSAGVMKMRNGANSAWISLYQLDGEWTSIAFENGTAAAPSIYFKDSGTDTGIYSPGANQVAISTNGTGRLFVDANGNVGLNTTPNFVFDALRSSAGTVGRFQANGTDSNISIRNNAREGILGADTTQSYLLNADAFPWTFWTNNTERMRLDSSGRLLVGTSSERTNVYYTTVATTPKVQFETTVNSYSNGLSLINYSATGFSPILTLGLSASNTQGTNTAIASTHEMGTINFVGNDGTNFRTGASIIAVNDQLSAWAVGDCPTRLVFSTTADGAASPTERMRITNGGIVVVGNTSVFSITSSTATGSQLSNDGYFLAYTSSQTAAYFGRQTSDGTIVEFRQDGTQEGSISVSGTTVSYNGAHLSRWSQLPGGTERTEILRGTVLSNIDEMCGWGEEENEQLNRMKVSDVEGDKNVSGVFQAWDDDDDTYTDDFYCAMTGDFIIPIAEGVTVQRGDLLMSAGDGTAKPQDDDIIRSKTIAKVTSTYVTCTYEDGSYCVPCVLMAC